MALSATESLLLTLGICGAVHLLVNLLQSLEAEDDNDYSAIMNKLARERFFQKQGSYVKRSSVRFYH